MKPTDILQSWKRMPKTCQNKSAKIINQMKATQQFCYEYFWSIFLPVNAHRKCFGNRFKITQKNVGEKWFLYCFVIQEVGESKWQTIWHMLSDNCSASCHLSTLVRPLMRWTNVLSSGTTFLLIMLAYSSKALSTLLACERLSIKEVYKYLLATARLGDDEISSSRFSATSSLPALI